MPEPRHAQSAADIAALAGSYHAVAQRSELRFRAKAFGLIWVDGVMPAAEGTLRIEDGKLSGHGVVAARHVDTGLRARDRHLRSSHYLHTTEHPAITLTVDGADLTSGLAECAVTVRDTTHAVPMTIAALDSDGDVLQLRATVELDRTPFPMLPPAAGVSRTVHVDLTVVAKKDGD